MFNIRVANKEDHAEQITNNNCAMALETENKILDEATAKFGVFDIIFGFLAFF